MKNHKIRPDNYEKRRKNLTELTDQELKERFWHLAEKAVDPLIDLAKKNTTPAIERSVLLRMGFSSIEAKELVDLVIKHGLISKGAGHVVYRYSKISNLSIRNSGLSLINKKGWSEVKKSFEVNYEG